MRKLLTTLAPAACCGFVVVLALLVSYTFAQSTFSDWSSPVNLGAIINSSSDDTSPALSKDGLSLYFHSNRTAGLGGTDIWVSRRKSVEEPWGSPMNLGMVINSTADDLMPNLSRDGHRLFFVSRRMGGLGGFDIWMSHREDIHDDLDWQPPVNVGAPVNSTSFDQSPFFFDNDDVGVSQLFLTRTVMNQNDLFVSNLQPDGTFGPASPLSDLNSSANDRGISVRFDGLEVFIMSLRTGGSGTQDLWTATRQSVSDPWSTPANLGPLVNSIAQDSEPHISSDGETLYFASARDGGFGGQDLYMTRRTRKKP
jgi:Tol biopolymer transport system component